MQIKDLLHASTRELRELQADGFPVATGRNFEKEILRVPTLVQSPDNTTWVQVSPTVFFLAEAGMRIPWLAVAAEFEGEMASMIIALSQLNEVKIAPPLQNGRLRDHSQKFIQGRERVLIFHTGHKVNVSVG